MLNNHRKVDTNKKKISNFKDKLFENSIYNKFPKI